MSTSWEMGFCGSEPSSADDDGRLADVQEEVQAMLESVREGGRFDAQTILEHRLAIREAKEFSI